jgi:hypothetical protein
VEGDLTRNEREIRDCGSGDEMQERIDLFTKNGVLIWDAEHWVGRVGDRRERDRVGDDTRVLEFALDCVLGTCYGSKYSAAVIITESLLSGS